MEDMSEAKLLGESKPIAEEKTETTNYISYEEVFEQELQRYVAGLYDHEGGVYSLCFTRDGELLISGSEDKTIKLWSVKTRKCVETLVGHSGYINQVTVTHDSNFIISCSSDKTLRKWFKPFKSLHFESLEGHSAPVTTVAVVYCEKIISGSEDKTVKVWDFKTLIVLDTLSHDDYVNTVAVNLEKRLFASGSDENIIKIYSLNNNSQLTTLEEHKSSVNCIKFHPNNNLLISCSDEGNLKVWDISEIHNENANSLRIKPKIEHKPHEQAIYEVSINSNGEIIVTASYDHTVKVMKMHSESEIIDISTFSVHFDKIYTVVFSPDSTTIASGSNDESIVFYDLNEIREDSTTKVQSSIQALFFSSDENHLIIFDTEGNFKKMTMKGNKIIESMEIQLEKMSFICVANKNSVYFSGSNFDGISVLDLQSENIKIAKISLENEENSEITAMTVSADEKFLLLATNKKKVLLFSITDSSKILSVKDNQGQKISMILQHVEDEDRIDSLAISKDLKFFVYGRADGVIGFFRISEREFETFLKGHIDKVSSLALTSDSRFLVSGSWDKTIRIWDMFSKQQVKELSGHFDRVNQVIISENDLYAVSTSKDKMIIVWDIKERIRKCYLYGHSNSVISVCINSENSFIASCSLDKTIKTWDIKNTNKEVQLNKHNKYISAIVICEKKQFIVSADYEGWVYLWDTQSKQTTLMRDFGEPVYSIAVDSGENYIICGLDSGDIKVIKINSKNIHAKPFKVGSYHTDSVRAMAMSPSGRFFVTGSEDCSVKIWNTSERIVNHPFKGHKNYVLSLAISHDGRFLLSGSRDERLGFWDVLEKEYQQDSLVVTKNNLKLNKKQLIDVALGNIGTISISIDGLYVIIGTDKNFVIVYRYNDLQDINVKPIKKDLKMEKSILFADMTEDNSEVVGVDYDGNLRRWNFNASRDVKNFKMTELLKNESAAEVYIVTSCKNKKYIGFGYVNGNILILDFKTTHKIKEKFDIIKNTNEKGLLALVFSPNSEFIVSGSDDGIITIWYFGAENKFINCQSTINSYINCLNITKYEEDYYIAAGFGDKRIGIWSLENNNLKSMFKAHDFSVNALVFSACSKYLISGSSDKTIKIWNIETMIREFQQKTYIEEKDLKVHSDFVWSVAISQNERYIISGSNDKTVIVWDFNYQDPEYFQSARHKTFFILNGHESPIFSVAITFDGKYIVSGDEEGTVKFWKCFPFISQEDKETEKIFENSKNELPKEKINPKVVPDEINQVEPKEALNVTEMKIQGQKGGDFNHQNFEETNFQEYIEEYSAYFDDNVYSIAVSKNNKYAVIGSADSTIKIWDIENRKQECELKSKDYVTVVVVSSDNKYILSASGDKHVTMWQMILENSISHEKFESVQKLEDFQIKLDWGYTEDFHKGFPSLNVSSQKIKLTQDHKFALYYSYNNIDTIFKRDLEKGQVVYRAINKQIWASKNIFDAYYHNSLSFFNVLDSLSLQDFSNLSSNACNISISQFNYTILHVLCFLGKSNDLEIFLSRSDFIIKFDTFEKSPFYYAIQRKNQSCVDILMSHINSYFKDHQLTKFENSIFALKNDFFLIISNSSVNLDGLLKNIFIASSQKFGNISKELPAYNCYDYAMPCIEDWSSSSKNQTEEKPFFFMHSAFPFVGDSGSEENYQMLKSILDCENDQIYHTPIIQYFLQIQWRTHRLWISYFTTLYFSNVVLFLLLIAYNFDSQGVLILFILLNSLLFLWEFIQFWVTKTRYFMDAYNVLDLFRVIFNIVWISLEMTNDPHVYVTWFMALLNLIRGLSGFRIFDGTRYYVRLILTTLYEIRYFYIIYFYSTFMFGVLFLVSRFENIGFDTLWQDPYAFNSGGYTEGGPSTNLTMDYIVYMGFSIVNLVLMLNLLVAVLNDAFNEFQGTKDIVDYKEKAHQIFEIETFFVFFKCARKKKNLKYLHACISTKNTDDDDTKVVQMENSINEMKIQINELDRKFQKRIENLDAKINSKLDSIIEKLS